MKIAPRLEGFITFITIIGTFTAVRLEVSIEEVPTSEQLGTVRLGTLPAGCVVGCPSVIGQTVGR